MRIAVATFTLIVACCMSRHDRGAPRSSVENNAQSLLRSGDGYEIAKGYALLRDRNDLSVETLRLVIISIPMNLPSERVRATGPETTGSAATDILVRNGRRAYPLLVDTLLSGDWNLRRYAAFALGELCDRSAVSPLSAAIMDELPRAAKSKVKIYQSEVPESALLSVLDAEVVASARLDRSFTLKILLGLFDSKSEHAFQNYYANHALHLLFPDSTVGTQVVTQDWWTILYENDWRTWLDSSGARPSVPACRSGL